MQGGLLEEATPSERRIRSRDPGVRGWDEPGLIRRCRVWLACSGTAGVCLWISPPFYFSQGRFFSGLPRCGKAVNRALWHMIWMVQVRGRCSAEQLDRRAAVRQGLETGFYFYGNVPTTWSERAQPFEGTWKGILLFARP